MIGTSGESLRNARNNPEASASIKQYFTRCPNSTARECCKVVGLNYEEYGGRARKIKYDITRWMRSTVPVTDPHGQLPKSLTSVHRFEFGFEEPVPAGYVAVLEEKALAGRVEGAWYRSPNRNRQLEYFDKHVSVRVYPRSRTCRIHPRRSMMFDEVRVHVEDAFAKVLTARALLGDSFQEMMKGLQVARRHRTFHIGPVTPFKVDFYRPSLGLDILADGSHPEHLEVRENWPAWIAPLLQLQRNNTMALSEFASQISSHLSVMQGIGLAADRLNEAVRDLARMISYKSNSSDLEARGNISRECSLESQSKFSETSPSQGSDTRAVKAPRLDRNSREVAT